MKIFLLTHLYPHLRSFVFFALPFFFFLVCTNELPSLSFAPLQKRNQVVPVEYPHWNCFQLININIQLFLQLYGVPLFMLQWTIGSRDGGERGPEGVWWRGMERKLSKKKKKYKSGTWWEKKGEFPGKTEDPEMLWKKRLMRETTHRRKLKCHRNKVIVDEWIFALGYIQGLG